MMELISRESALTLINDIRNRYMIMTKNYAICIGSDAEKMQKDAYEDIENRIEELQTIESRPKGEWIENSEDGYAECPFCHEATNCDDNIGELHYCWNCGAKLVADMRGE